MSPSQRRPTRPTNAARIMNRARVLWRVLVSLKASEIAKIAAIAEGTQWRRLKTIGTYGTLFLIKIWGEMRRESAAAVNRVVTHARFRYEGRF